MEGMRLQDLETGNLLYSISQKVKLRKYLKMSTLRVSLEWYGKEEEALRSRQLTH